MEAARPAHRTLTATTSSCNIQEQRVAETGESFKAIVNGLLRCALGSFSQVPCDAIAALGLPNKDALAALEDEDQPMERDRSWGAVALHRRLKG